MRDYLYAYMCAKTVFDRVECGIVIPVEMNFSYKTLIHNQKNRMNDLIKRND